MICRTCGIKGHDSLGKKEVCLVAVSARCGRHEALLLEAADALDEEGKVYHPTHTHRLADEIRDALK